jgi:predicted dehydrogenase
MAERIKCGVIGAGWWATFAHIPALLAHPRAELVAIQTLGLRDAEKVAKDFGVPYAFDSAEKLIHHDGIQAVVISSSPNQHYRQALAALSNGLHVLIEKPMTITAAESLELVQLADERGLQFLISCPWHYTPHGKQAQRLLRDHALGEIRLVSILMTNPISHLLRGLGTRPTHGDPYIYPSQTTYSDPAIAGGGQIYAQVSHVAAYLTFLTGARPRDVFARFHNDGEVTDIYNALCLRMSDDSIVSIASTGETNLNRRDFEVRIFATKGMIFLDLWKGTMEVIPMQGSPVVMPDLRPEEIYPERAPARNLIDAITGDDPNQSPASLGTAAMEVIEAAQRSAQSGGAINVATLYQVGV